ncbi:uncharacterized protein LOC5516691 [Nematostella vectensis]|uniref:uncharacterized protein LOC5516691 n=1 Tax=Nematostella vectensis TaxID=45351 RepID=UPI0020778E93|nr:uncharacterized protein LOC5516691 [Nematostella vectensis]
MSIQNQVQSDTETSLTSNTSDHIHDEEPPAIIVGFKNPLLASVITTLCLIIIWAVALLPLYFYLSPLPSPAEGPATNSSNLTLPHYPCNAPLILNPVTHLCTLPCGWRMFTPLQAKAGNIVDNISLVVSLLGFLFIFATWMAIKQLRMFPHIIPLYIQCLSSIISFVIVVGNGMGQEKSFCTDEFYPVPEKRQTSFCTAQGLIIQYLSNVLALWFVVYSFTLLKMINSNTINPRQNTQTPHLLYSAICWLLPIISVAMVLSKDKYAPFIMRICAPSNSKYAYFTNSAITQLAQGVGCTCLFFVVYKLCQMRNLDGVAGIQAQSRRKNMDKIAIRLVCLMFAYAMCVALVYIPTCVQLRHKNLLQFYVKKYVACLMFAQSSDFCPKEYEQFTFADTWIASYLSSALFAISTVSFLAFNKQSRHLWAHWWNLIVLCCCPPEQEMIEVHKSG